MCGIAGAVGTRLPDDIAPRVWELLAERGPDDHGYLALRGTDAHIAREWDPRDAGADALLIHTRLCIIDVSEAGWQPMSSSDGRFHIIFNGEVYNYIELRRKLEALGRTFRSASDTEVLIEAFAEWGPDCLSRVVGMFALAIVDSKDRKLFLARDPFGIKPLLMTRRGNAFAFASTVRALRELIPGDDRADRDHVLQYLRFGVTDHDSGTMFRGVEHLPPAHHMTVSIDDGTTNGPVRYWEPKLGAIADISKAEAAERLRDLFLQSVDFHLRSDVRVGAALSGGVDSSSIVMAMREVRGTDLDILAFSFIPDDPAISEEAWIDQVGAAAGAHVAKVRPTAADLVADLGNVIAAQGEPFQTPSIYASYRVFRLAAESGVTVMLDGQGADELLGGYHFDISARLASLIRQLRGVRAWRLMRNTRHRSPTRSGLLVEAGRFMLPRSSQRLARRLAGRPLAPPWLATSPGDEEVLLNGTGGYVAGRHVLRRHAIDQIGVNLVRLLRYEDRNSMAFSIESRVPFLTSPLADFILSLPEEYIISDQGETKSVFRDAMRGIVPDSILDRRDKIGFQTPSSWFREAGPWVDGVIASDAAGAIPLLDLDALRATWEAVRGGDTTGEPGLWRALNLIEWSRQFDIEVA
jgi:asparagine synthase (glutamine-hydrolysing)